MSLEQLIQQNLEHLIVEYSNRLTDTENNRFDEYFAAVKIQSWFRGVKWRKQLKYLNECATKIQKTWRGYMGRQKFRRLAMEKKDQEYNKMRRDAAIMIQKTWKGYYSRKYKHDYYAQKMFLNGIQKRHKIYILEKLEKSKQINLENKIDFESNQEKELKKYCIKNHHLVGTNMIDGVYSSKYHPKLQKMNDLIKYYNKMENKKSMREIKKKMKLKCITVENKYSNPTKPFDFKGPFKAPSVVFHLRHKKLEPTLRVQTDYFSIENAREQLKMKEYLQCIHDKTFNFKKIDSLEYESQLHSQFKYDDRLKYGSKHFRYYEDQ
ncbi:Spermatogenesis-associated protein 17 [Intoshia linei]|uniref:Spermatogenesis-associated protein 17 n=1 Tax=Intoshia linei TaxID=1819745 RepID=A0A177B5T5_9BILA|nr:Spermatogenesis-associated protein 17 [Intoshia linei]